MDVLGGMMCVLAPWIVSVAVGSYLGWERNRPIDGIVLGLILGPLGMILTACLPYRYRWFCPECETGVKRSAKRCPACRTKLS